MEDLNENLTSAFLHAFIALNSASFCNKDEIVDHSARKLKKVFLCLEFVYESFANSKAWNRSGLPEPDLKKPEPGLT